MKSVQQRLEEIFVAAQKEAEAFAAKIGFAESGSRLRRKIFDETAWWEKEYGVDDYGYCPVLDFVDGPRRVAEKWVRPRCLSALEVALNSVNYLRDNDDVDSVRAIDLAMNILRSASVATVRAQRPSADVIAACLKQERERQRAAMARVQSRSRDAQAS
jgi:hypothetical protein